MISWIRSEWLLPKPVKKDIVAHLTESEKTDLRRESRRHGALVWIAPALPLLPLLVWPSVGGMNLACAVVAWLILEMCLLYHGFRKFRRLLLSTDWAKETGYRERFGA